MVLSFQCLSPTCNLKFGVGLSSYISGPVMTWQRLTILNTISVKHVEALKQPRHQTPKPDVTLHMKYTFVSCNQNTVQHTQSFENVLKFPKDHLQMANRTCIRAGSRSSLNSTSLEFYSCLNKNIDINMRNLLCMGVKRCKVDVKGKKVNWGCSEEITRERRGFHNERFIIWTV